MIAREPKQSSWGLITSPFLFVMITFQPDQFLNIFHHAAVQAPELAQQVAQSKGETRGWPVTAAHTASLSGGWWTAADENLKIQKPNMTSEEKEMWPSSSILSVINHRAIPVKTLLLFCSVDHADCVQKWQKSSIKFFCFKHQDCISNPLLFTTDPFPGQIIVENFSIP